MAQGGTNDFFLQFGSNAEEFSSKIAAELEPGTKSLKSLTSALAKYEEQAAKSKGGGSPLGASLSGLDSVVSRMEEATTRFTDKLAGQLTEMTGRVETLARVAARLQGVGRGPASGPQGGGPNRGFSATGEQAAYERGLAAGRAQAPKRSNVSEVPPREQVVGAGTTSREAAATTAAVSEAEVAAAKNASALATALGELSGQLKSLREETASVRVPRPSNTATPTPETSGEVAVSNTPANPVPVTIVRTEGETGQGAKGEEKKPEEKKAERRRGPAQSRAIPASEGPQRRLPNLAAASGNFFDSSTNAGIKKAFESLDEKTQTTLRQGRSAIASGTLSQAEIHSVVTQASAALLHDSQIKNRSLFPGGAADRQNLLAGALGLDPQATNMRGYLRDQMKEGGYATNFMQEQAARGAGPSSPKGDVEAQRQVRYNQILAESSEQVRSALLAQFIAQNSLNDIEAKGTATASELARAQIQLANADRQVSTVQQKQSEEQNQGAFAKLTGRPGATFGNTLRNRLGHELPNVVGYQLIFSGFEKLREVVHTGLEAQAAFARLQSSLDANGVSAGNLKSQLASISANTATPIETVIQAASELSGTFRDAGTIEFGAHISAQLASISQGALSATEAADALRDVYAAFGNTWTANGLVGGKQTQKDVKAGLKRTGDQIAYLSQTTGVNVKDITEGTSEIAPEAREFGLNQYQASTLSAYITKTTGLKGEESSSLLTRMMATLYNGKTQNALVSARVATNNQFAEGDLGGVIQNLIGKYEGLKPTQRNQIAAAMGTGPAAKVFSALVSGGRSASASFTNDPSKTDGALNRQMSQYLNTIAGQVKKLSEDFQNLGVELQKIGAFDAIGLLAKALDVAAVSAQKLLHGIDDLFGHSAANQSMLHLIVILGEGAAAWKLFGGAAVSAMTKVGLVKMTPTNSVARAEAAQAGAVVPKAEYDQMSMRAAGANIGGRAWGGVRNLPSNVGKLPADLKAVTRLNAAQEEEQAAIAARTKAEASLAEAETKATAALQISIESDEALATAQKDGAALETDLNKLRADQMEATAALTAASERLAAAQTVQAEAAVVAAAANEASSAASIAAGGASGLARGVSGLGSRLMPIAGIAAIMAAAPVGHMVSGGQSASGANATGRGLAGVMTQDTMYGAGLGAMFGGPVGAAVGGGAGALYGVGKSFLNEKKYKDSFASTKSSDDEIAFMQLAYNNPNSSEAVRKAQTRLGYKAPVKGMGIDQIKNLGTADEVTKFEKTETDFINSHAKDIEKAGGNSKKAQASIKANLDRIKTALKDAATKRLANLQGLSDLDQMNMTQIDTVSALMSTISQFNSTTMATQGTAIKQMLSDSGLANTSGNQKLIAQAAGQANDDAGVLGLNDKNQVGSYDAYGNWHPASKLQQKDMGATAAATMTHVSSPVGTAESRRAAQDQIEQNIIKQTTASLATGLYGKNTDGYTDLKQRQSDAILAKQQLDAEKYTIPQTLDQAQASFFQSTGQDAKAVSSLQASDAQLTAYNKTLQHDDPQYYANLAQIQQNKLAIAALLDNPALTQLAVNAAATNDAGQKAADNLQAARIQLQSDLKNHADSGTIKTDRVNAASAGLTSVQTSQDVQSAQASVGIASVRNTVGNAQLQLNETQRQMGLAENSATADAATFYRLQAQEVQQQQALRDAIEARRESVFDATQALDQMHGDDVGAAQQGLDKAQMAYLYAVQQYGTNSQQAETALAAKYQAQSALVSAELTKQNSALDLQVAQLNARGALGDDVSAAKDQTKEAQNALASYTKHGGKKGTATYNQLAGAVATARRNQFDVALQAQLDTLDFQQETYKITSSQEVASLQKILDNKNLTLKEQRDITLKIKNMQNSIREQLTSGGLNIPSNITLPTAYDVRRSLGSGFSGSTTHTEATNTVNNNQQVTVNNNVPSTTVANQIASQVIKMINTQTSAQVRANTSTPRIVSTR